MAVTESTMLPLGCAAPDFTLPDPAGKHWSLKDFWDARGLLVVFMCNHCPFVKHLRSTLVALAGEYRARDIKTVAINANDVVGYPEDAPEKMALMAREIGMDFPYLYDASQAVAKDYRAACTPDLFLFDRNRKLFYRGRFDDSTPGNGKPVTGRDLRAALDALLDDRPAPQPQIPSMGCNIKWRRGNEPDYFS